MKQQGRHNIVAMDEFLGGDETAREWVSLLREWRAATGQRDPTQ